MDIQGRSVWQHAAGDRWHKHVDLCLKYDVLLKGGVDPFPKDMRDGDVVLLKHGLSNVHGVGVVGREVQSKEFLDVDGWILEYVRRVRWVWKNEEEPKHFPKALARAMTQRLGHKHPEIREWIASLDDSGPDSELSPLPHGGEDVDADHIAEFLFQRGIASDSIRHLLDPHGEFLRVANWYWSWPWRESPSEHETVTHLVVPLLQILGWQRQRIALGGTAHRGRRSGRMDIALYSTVCGSRRSGVSAILEAKKVKNACLAAVGQATGYAERHPECRRIIVTDGLRYGVFVRNSNEQEFRRYGYLNLIRPRTKYPIYDGCFGAKEALLAMTPEWSPDSVA